MLKASAFQQSHNTLFAWGHSQHQNASDVNIITTTALRRVKAFKDVGDWVVNFIQTRDLSVISTPPNNAGPDLAYWLNSETLVVVGVKTSCTGKGVPNSVLTQNSTTTVLDSMLANKRNHALELLWRERFNQALHTPADKATKPLKHLIRIHVALPYRPPKRTVNAHFMPGAVWQVTDTVRKINVTTFDFDQNTLHHWIPADVVTQMAQRFKLTQ